MQLANLIEVAGRNMEQVGVFINGFKVHEMMVHGFSKFKNNRVQPGIIRGNLVLAGVCSVQLNHQLNQLNLWSGHGAIT